MAASGLCNAVWNAECSSGSCQAQTRAKRMQCKGYKDALFGCMQETRPASRPVSLPPVEHFELSTTSRPWISPAPRRGPCALGLLLDRISLLTALDTLSRHFNCRIVV